MRSIVWCWRYLSSEMFGYWYQFGSCRLTTGEMKSGTGAGQRHSTPSREAYYRTSSNMPSLPLRHNPEWRCNSWCWFRSCPTRFILVYSRWTQRLLLWHPRVVDIWKVTVSYRRENWLILLDSRNKRSDNSKGRRRLLFSLHTINNAHNWRTVWTESMLIRISRISRYRGFSSGSLLFPNLDIGIQFPNMFHMSIRFFQFW